VVAAACALLMSENPTLNEADVRRIMARGLENAGPPGLAATDRSRGA
jgi:hypothetical protein